MSQDLLPFAPFGQSCRARAKSLFSVALFEPQASQRLKDLRLYVDERCGGLLAVRGPVSVPELQARGDRAGDDEGTFVHGPVMRPAKKENGSERLSCRCTAAFEAKALRNEMCRIIRRSPLRRDLQCRDTA